MKGFIIKSLCYDEFSWLFLLDEAELKRAGAVRMKADTHPGFPCRVSLEDALPGEEVILISYRYHQADSPYCASGPIYIRKNAKEKTWNINDIPAMLTHRMLSIRAYDQTGFMKNATLVDGSELSITLHKLFEDPGITYIHIHNAKPGCFNCMAVRA
jgi:hypothetical protein